MVANGGADEAQGRPLAVILFPVSVGKHGDRQLVELPSEPLLSNAHREQNGQRKALDPARLRHHRWCICIRVFRVIRVCFSFAVPVSEPQLRSISF